MRSGMHWFWRFPDVRTCIHNQGMPDGRGILLPCEAKKRRQYFVYCKIFQRGRPAKDPLRRYQMVVNTGSKVGLEGEGMVDILDVKCDPILIGSLLHERGFRPAYHMNKANWITILLDGSLPEDQVFDLLHLSFELTRKKR